MSALSKSNTCAASGCAMKGTEERTMEDRTLQIRISFRLCRNCMAKWDRIEGVPIYSTK